MICLAKHVRFPDDLRPQNTLDALFTLTDHEFERHPPEHRPKPSKTHDAIAEQSTSNTAYQRPGTISKALRGALKRQGEGSCLGGNTARHMHRGNAERAHS